MPLWRCPHCGVPQVESSRCWVCRRSTTSCAACLHFRRGIAGGLGVCGRDPRHLALQGSEMRACWEAADTTGSLDPGEGDASAPVRIPVMASTVAVAGRPVRTFVPVDSLPGHLGSIHQDDDVVGGDPYPGVAVMTGAAAQVPGPAFRARRIPGGWSLWGDLES